MKCIIRLKVTDGLTIQQQIYVLSNIITQTTFFLREERYRQPLFTKYEMEQIPSKPSWQVVLYFDNDYLNTVMHIFASERFNVINGNIYSFDYEMD